MDESSIVGSTWMPTSVPLLLGSKTVSASAMVDNLCAKDEVYV